MRYSSLGGGKRFRPFLVVECAALFEVPRQQALMAGAALECVHCYSLVHDDLPAMDNDDLRRGQPTAHKAFDEATAILAGDGLLTFAFDILSRPQTHPDPAVRIELVNALARASGLGGMVGGQMLDLAAEGRFGGNGPQRLGEKEVRTLQAMKTGALLRFACEAGGMLGSATAAQRKRSHVMDRPSARLSRSPTTFSISKAITALVGKSDRQRRRCRQGYHGRCAWAGRRQGEACGTRHRGRTGACAVRCKIAAILVEGADFVAERRMRNRIYSAPATCYIFLHSHHFFCTRTERKDRTVFSIVNL